MRNNEHDCIDFFGSNDPTGSSPADETQANRQESHEDLVPWPSGAPPKKPRRTRSSGGSPLAGLFVPPTYVPHRVLDKIWSYLDPARREPEAGGLLLGPRGTDNLILDFIFDEEATTTRVSYTLGTEFLNRALAEAGAVGLDGKGMVHSHPGDATQLSSGDLIYVRKVFTHAPGVEMFLMPVVAGRRIFPWVVSRQAPNHPVLSPFVVI